MLLYLPVKGDFFMKENSLSSIIILRVSEDSADSIFNEISNCLFDFSYFDESLLGKKVYICTLGPKEAIVGHVRISKIYHDKPYKILIDMGHYKDEYSDKIIKKFGKYNRDIYAVMVDDVTEFDLQLPLTLAGNSNINCFIKKVYSDRPLYYIVKEWDKEFSLDHKICDNPIEKGNSILKKYLAK